MRPPASEQARPERPWAPSGDPMARRHGLRGAAAGSPAAIARRRRNPASCGAIGVLGHPGYAGALARAFTKPRK